MFLSLSVMVGAHVYGRIRTARVMRVLCSDGLYDEVQPLHYANSPLSRTLVGNKPAQAFQRL